MTYKLYTKNGRIFGSGYMPIPCGSLVNSWCPLKINQTITYSTPFQVEIDDSMREFYEWPLKVYLAIEFFGRNGSEPSKRPMFRFTLPVTMEFSFSNRIRKVLNKIFVKN